jgi:hypothetical protein
VPVVMVTSGSKVAAFDFLCMVCPRMDSCFSCFWVACFL